jgi:hypothetical protein
MNYRYAFGLQTLHQSGNRIGHDSDRLPTRVLPRLRKREAAHDVAHTYRRVRIGAQKENAGIVRQS